MHVTGELSQHQQASRVVSWPQGSSDSMRQLHGIYHSPEACKVEQAPSTGPFFYRVKQDMPQRPIAHLQCFQQPQPIQCTTVLEGGPPR
jgi:hypothetical protein